jgi:hypothetical protein
VRRRPIIPSRTGARFDALLSFETWQEFGARIATHANASSWWIGDWMVFGQAKYGRRYKQAMGVTRLDYQTLRNYAVVARRFEMSRRRDDLSFQHHAEVCALTDAEQDRWLARAAEGRWTRTELRRRVRAGRDREADTQMVRFTLPSARLDAWREAARLANLGFEAWVVRALDDAARRPRPSPDDAAAAERVRA